MNDYTVSKQYAARRVHELREQIAGCMAQASIGKRNGETGPNDRMQNNIRVARACYRELVCWMHILHS